MNIIRINFDNTKIINSKINMHYNLNNYIQKIYKIYLFLFIIYLVKQSFIFKIKNKYNNFNYNLEKIRSKINNNTYIDYINACKELKKLKNKKKLKKKNPFISICICVYNSKKYIEKAILSIINQSFQDIEIIIVNDFSNDSTYNIIMKLASEDRRIKVINHTKNLGTYYSRVECVLNSKGKYISFLDPDDLYLNPYLFEILFQYYNFYNIDIIEFTVYHQIEEENKIFYPKRHNLNHNHNFTNIIVYQPELSDIIFYKPNTKNYSYIICRTIWNKLVKRDTFLKSINYIGKDYYQNHYIIIIEDTLLNLINFHFARNYTNIIFPGYMYNIRKYSITNSKQTIDHLVKKCISFYLFYQLLLRYIKEFNKDRNYLFYDLLLYKNELINIKKYNVRSYLKNVTNFLIDIMNDNNTSIKFKYFIKDIYKIIINNKNISSN